MRDDCLHSEFRCKHSGVCLKNVPRITCDGLIDCPPGEDETDCDAVNFDMYGGDEDYDRGYSGVERSCLLWGGHWCAVSQTCIPASKKCDGVFHCSDYSDELECSPSAHLSSVEDYGDDDYDELFPAEYAGSMYTKCREGHKIILKLEVCDGEKDCSDGSDEEDCDEKKKKKLCGPDEFSCPDMCIPETFVCDDYHDCFDGSDEKNCSLKKEICKTPFKICNGTCQLVHELCEDALDATCATESHPLCNVCHWGRCSQLCRNVDLKPVCSCRDGYELERDNFTCTSKYFYTGKPYLLFAGRHDIKKIDIYLPAPSKTAA
ncbi:hypothetical protein HELRODRAFT_193978, partial [Helobdella robusta]|uniref:EGF-like domain-containing protein n=1 Tax=Helobdella robusta TaxID=6412 RepID=T1FVJ1_HELRO